MPAATATLAPETAQRIQQLIAAAPVVLFMKGQRGAPQCGFSATVCEILDRYVPEYNTVNVLADPALRDGIKQFSDWPTVPQLYVKGEFVGGCDIVQEMAGDGTLLETLGVEAPAPAAAPPAIHVSAEAAAELQRAQLQQPAGAALHLRVDARFQNAMYFGPPEPGETKTEAAGIAFYLDALSAARADGMQIAMAESAEGGAGFQIQNPNAPAAPTVAQMQPAELKALMDSGAPFQLYDVRTPEERAQAHIEGAQLLTESAAAQLETLPFDTLLVFHCHHGGRSQAAAEHFAGRGFTRVHNLSGGIDAWAQQVDSGVPRY